MKRDKSVSITRAQAVAVAIACATDHDGAPVDAVHLHSLAEMVSELLDDALEDG